MTLDQFVAKYHSIGIDFDGSYGKQCVDLYRQYLKEVLNLPQSPSVVGAADIWDSYRKSDFEAIKNTPTGVPQKGDVVIWNKKAGGGFGHVAIATTGTTKSFTSLDQNWNPQKCELVVHTYINVIGWLRPKVQSIPTPMPETDLTAFLSTFKVKDLTEAEFKWNEDKSFLEDERKKVTKLESQVKDHESHLEELSTILTCTVDYHSIVAETKRLLNVEETNRQLEKKLDQEEKKHDLEVNAQIERINELTTAVKKGQDDYEALLGQLDILKGKYEALESQGTFITKLQTIINSLFKRK